MKKDGKGKIILVAVIGHITGIAEALRSKSHEHSIVIVDKKEDIGTDINIIKLTNSFPIRSAFNLEALLVNPFKVINTSKITPEETDRSFRKKWEEKNKAKIKHMLTVGKHQDKAPHKHLF